MLNQVEKKLADILPPREFEIEGQQYIQKVCAVPASRDLIVAKASLLDKRLEDAQVCF